MEIVKITPPEEDLLIKDDQKILVCNQPNCSKQFSNSGSLSMHLIKVHQIFQNERCLRLYKGRSVQNTTVQYHCPVVSCNYNGTTGRSFKSMVQLRRHFDKIHAEKKFKCHRCGAAYVRQTDQEKHKKSCKATFMCSVCLSTFEMKRLLYEHCIETDHRYAFDDIPPPVSTVTSEPSNSSPDIGIASRTNETYSTDRICKTKPNSAQEISIDKDTDVVSYKTHGNRSNVSHRVENTKIITNEGQPNESALTKASASRTDVQRDVSGTPKIINISKISDIKNLRFEKRSQYCPSLKTRILFEESLSKEKQIGAECIRTPAADVQTFAAACRTSKTPANECLNVKAIHMLKHTQSYTEGVTNRDIVIGSVPNVVTTASTLATTTSLYSDVMPLISIMNKSLYANSQTNPALVRTVEGTTLSMPTAVTSDSFLPTTQACVGSNPVVTSTTSAVITPEHSFSAYVSPFYNKTGNTTTPVMPSPVVVRPTSINVKTSHLKPSGRNFPSLPVTKCSAVSIPARSSNFEGPSGNLFDASSKYRNILPKSSSFLVLPPNFEGNIIMNTTNYIYNHTTTETVQPKPLKAILPRSSVVSISTNESQRSGPETDNVSQLDGRSSIPTQTDLSRSDRQRNALVAVETQTSGDEILKIAMRSAKVPIMRESRSSQVSPKAKLKRTHRQMDTTSCETQTQVAQLTGRAAKRRRKGSFIGCDAAVNTSSSRPKSGAYLAKGTQFHDVAVQEIQTETESLLPLPSVEEMARIVESISTQTAQSYLAASSEVSSTAENVRDSQMQTHLHMGMGFDACSRVDIESLRELGFSASITEQQRNKILNPSSTAPVTSPLTFENPQPDCRNENFYSPSKYNTTNELVISNPGATCTVSKPPPSYEEATCMTMSLPSPMFTPLSTDTSSSTNTNLATTPQGVTTAVSDLPASIQTQCDDFSLTGLLSTEVQTIDFDQLIDIETQTMDTGDSNTSGTPNDLIEEILFSHIETQTTEDFLQDLVLFNDSHTQTNDLSWKSPQIASSTPSPFHRSFTSPLSVSVGSPNALGNPEAVSQHNVEVQASIEQMESSGSHVVSADTETQTLFEDALTDSHTQTSWKDLMKS